MILLEPANKITHANVGDQAADHLSNPVSRELGISLHWSFERLDQTDLGGHFLWRAV